MYSIILKFQGLSNGINPQAAAAAALNPQAALYGSMPRLPILPTSAAGSIPGGPPTGSPISNLVRSQNPIPMLPPQILAQLGQTGLPRLPNGIPGLNLNQLTAQIAGSQANLTASISAKLGNSEVQNGNSDNEEKSKVEEIISNPSSPVNSESA